MFLVTCENYETLLGIILRCFRSRGSFDPITEKYTERSNQKTSRRRETMYEYGDWGRNACQPYRCQDFSQCRFEFPTLLALDFMIQLEVRPNARRWHYL